MAKDLGKRLSGAFHSRGHDARGDNRGFEQSQIVVGKIENFRNRAQVGAALKVNADQT